MKKIDCPSAAAPQGEAGRDGLSVFDIQRYCIHDGEGIRTTVFFKGCPLRCAWCHNPESQAGKPELLWNEERCTGCGACEAACLQKAVWGGCPEPDRSRCIACGACVQACLGSARQVAGIRYSPEELAAAVCRDRMFYEESGGGATLSGGEVLAAEPFPAVLELCRLLKEEGISVFIDTCGQAPFERFEQLLEVADCFLYDIKAMDSQKHRKWTGVGNELILQNLWKLHLNGARIRLRLPLVEGVNAEEEDILPVIGLLKKGLRAEKIHLLSYHDFGRSKAQRLGHVSQPSFQAPSREKLEGLAELFRGAGFPQVVIGG